jgi:membrane-bound lytic murein transglycosylase B
LRALRILGLGLCLIAMSGGARADEQSFAQWRAGFRAEALAAGIEPATFDLALARIGPMPEILDLDHRQLEIKLDLRRYLARIASPERRRGVAENLAKNRELLDQIGRRYGVQPRFIVALWGIETSFGRSPGNFPVIAALATLAFDGRRATLFKRELIAALRIVERDHVSPDQMLGSWAGAMGQCQFMPSSFLDYAVSYDGSGRPDIWENRADVFASIANYLAKLGWRDGEGWGRLARVPKNLPASLVGIDVVKPLTQWRRLGVKRANGDALPPGKMEASLLLPEGKGGPAILAYPNFRTILKWNNSVAFAAAVGLLADSGESR